MPESPEAPVRRYLKQLFALSQWFGATTFAFGLFLLSSSPPIVGQDKPSNGAAWRPPELVATDKDIRALLDKTSASCEFSASDLLERAQKAVQIADARGLVRDRALATDVLASAYVSQGNLELAFATFQKAMQDAVDSKNGVLEADILITLALEAQTKGDTARALELLSRALSISESSGSLYERSRTLGESGKLKLLSGKTDEGVRAIDEALQIDQLNGYGLEALHLAYRGVYLGLAGKVNDAAASLMQARSKALATKDAYSFITAENTYAFALVQQGKADDAIGELELIKQGQFQAFVQDSQQQTCLASALNLPVLHLAVLEGFANVLVAANRIDRATEIWLETLSYSRDHSILIGQAEAAQKAANLYNQAKKPNDALKYFAIAADLLRKLNNEAALHEVEVSEAILLVNAERGKDALPLLDRISSYAKAHNNRQREFFAQLLIGEIYQPTGDLEHARAALEVAEALVRPGPFDSEVNNRSVMEAYTRLADIYRAQSVPMMELLSIHKAFLTALHLKDEKVQQNLVTYLDQRISDLKTRTVVERDQKDGQLADALEYSYVLYLRDGLPKPNDDQSNWQRILTVPFQIAAQPGGGATLTKILAEVGPLVGFEKLPILNALGRYYIAAGNDPVLAEKYSLEAEETIKGMKGDFSGLKVESSCVLAVSYARQSKRAAAQERSDECLSLANKTKDAKTIAYAEAMNAMVQAQNGNFAATKSALQNLLTKDPENAELQVELAMSLANAKLYSEAQSGLDSAVKRFLSSGDKKAAAGAYVRMSVVLNSDNSREARDLQIHYLNEGRKIYHDISAPGDEARTLTAIGEYYLNLSEPDKAIPNFTNAYELAPAVGGIGIRAESAAGLGNAYQAQKDFRKASEFHKKAVDDYAESKGTLQQVIALESLSEDYVALHQLDDALASLLEAKKMASAIPVPNQYFLAYFLSEFYRKQGQFEKALVLLREAIATTRAGGDLEHCGYAHLATAELDELIGSWEDALNESESALKLFQDLGDKKGQAASWADLTGVYSDRNSSVKDFDKARKCYAQAHDLGYGETLQLDLAELYLQTGNYAEILRIANESLQICTKNGNTACQAHALISVSEANRLSGNTKVGRTALNQAEPFAKRSEDVYLRGRFLYAQARQLTSENRLNEALATYKELIRLIETVKGGLDARDQRSIAENYGYIYDELVALLYSLSQKDSSQGQEFAAEALEYAEINKAKQFVQAWGRTFVDGMRRSLSASTQETERSLLARRDRILAELNSSGDTAQLSRHTDTELAAVQQDIQAFLKELRKTAPQYAAVAYPEEIQLVSLPLRKGETLLEFKVTTDATFGWVVQNRSGNGNELVSFYKVPLARSWFLDRVSLLRKALNLGQPDTIDWKTSEEIFAALFPNEVATLLAQSQDVIFIPDDVLFALPFELFSPRASKGDFVLLRTASTYYPSALAFRLGRTASRSKSWQSAFLGLADPITSPNDERFEAAKAGSSAHDATSNDSTDSGRLKSRGFSFERLPGTATEVQGIAKLLQAGGEKTELRIGIDATKTELLDTDLAKFRFLHFATHGVLPVDTNVREPALVLSYDGVSPSHMFLPMSEVLGLKLQSESVVLSACNTGSGTISKAEGVMSLGRAFLAAGSSSVTVSLWQVSDESTAVLMQEYYRHLLKGERKSAALAEARNTIFSKGFKDPFFWAPFILIGE
jgi:CHAT domain-containing protein